MAEVNQVERVTTKSGRRYKKPKRDTHPVNHLIPPVLDVIKLMFPIGEDGPSVTTVLGALAKPALIGWAAREERKHVGQLAADLYRRLPDLVDGVVTPEKFYEMLSDEAGKPANRRLLEKAANVGTQVHTRIEWEFKGELGRERDVAPAPFTSKQAERAFDRWQEWRKSVNLKAIDMEKRLYSTVFGYGGTLDLLAEVTISQKEAFELGLSNTPGFPGAVAPVTVLVVIDFKTGKGIYGEAFLQNIAYRMAASEEGIRTKGGIIVRLPKYEEDPEFDAQFVPNDPSLAPTFLALLVVYKWWERDHNKKGPKGVKPQEKVASPTPEKVVE